MSSDLPPGALAIPARELLDHATKPSVTVADVLRAEAENWKRRYRELADLYRTAPARTVVLRCDQGTEMRVQVDRVHDFARLEGDRGDVVILDKEALRLACAAVGLAVTPVRR